MVVLHMLRRNAAYFAPKEEEDPKRTQGKATLGRGDAVIALHPRI